MFYSNEIRPAMESGTDKFEVKEQERALATQLIESLAAPFEPDKYHDTYQEGLRTLIEAKAQGQDVIAVPAAAQAPQVDLMAALKQSLMQKQQPPRGEKKSLLRVVPKSAQADAEEPPAQAPKKSRRKVG
jgi:DNA end-binding protein Ku